MPCERWVNRMVPARAGDRPEDEAAPAAVRRERQDRPRPERARTEANRQRTRFAGTKAGDRVRHDHACPAAKTFSGRRHCKQGFTLPAQPPFGAGSPHAVETTHKCGELMVAIVGRGTEEAAWRAWAAPAGWPRLDLRPCRRAVVVAPHPDDEVLGTGGIIAMLRDLGVPVTVVAVTDGEASHPYSAAVDGSAMAGRRSLESQAAAADLGLAPGSRLRLGVADGRVAAASAAIVDALTSVLQADAWCLSTWRSDGHPDHESAGLAAYAACRAVGARLLEFPIWMWHWAEPEDRQVPWDRACVVDLPAEAAQRKELAISRFVSQTEPLGPGEGDGAILPPHVVARFRRGWETVLA
jgi:LmbE family N-acetylglucosaminyl deacetylase